MGHSHYDEACILPDSLLISVSGIIFNRKEVPVMDTKHTAEQLNSLKKSSIHIEKLSVQVRL